MRPPRHHRGLAAAAALFAASAAVSLAVALVALAGGAAPAASRGASPSDPRREAATPPSADPVARVSSAAGPAVAAPADAVAPAESDSAKLRLHVPGAGDVFVVPGVRAPSEALPLVTALHAMCIDPEENCAYLEPLARGRAVLVCPTGNAACSDGTADWAVGAGARAELVRRSVAHAEGVLGVGRDPERGDVLFGSSRGAYVARDLVYLATEPRWRALVLVGASIVLEPERVRRAGIRRVLLAAPDLDDAARTMRRAQAVLCRAAIPARFVSLGPHHHGMVADSPAILARSMGWLLERGPDDACPAP